jgi:DNA-binding CsgD family transcriptional regulator
MKRRICLREKREVIQLLAGGKTNNQVGNILDISIRTIETYRARIVLKLQLRSIAELVRYAVRNGIVEA